MTGIAPPIHVGCLESLLAKKKAPSSSNVSPTWLPVQKKEDWVRLQVYPDVIADKKTSSEYQHKARTILKRSGFANLRYLCDIAGLAVRPQHDSVEQLTSLLLASDSHNELLYLATFLRSRKSAVVEYYEGAATETDKSKLASEVASHRRRRVETPKPFIKLITLYRSTPSVLEAIHYRHAWRRMQTTHSYSTSDQVDQASIKKLSDNVDALIAALDLLKPGESYEWFGNSRLSDSTTVFIIHRRFPPTVRADYQNKFRLQHDFSTVAFAVDDHASSFYVKVANKAVTEAVRDWISASLNVTLHDSGSALFSKYVPDSVEQAFLGGYDESHGIDLIQISFRHSFGPNHSPISLTAASDSRSIREDLSWLKASNVIRLRSFSDIATFQLRYDGHEISVESIIETGGAVRFQLNDIGLTEIDIDSLRSAFESAFLVPLDQNLDPTRFSMGPSDIYHFLLTGVRDDQVQPYQRATLEKLLDLELLSIVDGKTGRCTDVQCSNHSQAVVDGSAKECPSCQGPLTWQTIRRYEEDKDNVLRFVKKRVQRATGWHFDSYSPSLESHKFHRLCSPDEPGKTVCMFVNDRLSSSKMDTFHRAMFPVIVVHPLGQQSLPVIDASGIAHVGLPYLLAACDNTDDWKKYQKSCRELVPRLLRAEEERILRASRMSHQHMMAKPTGYDDRSYEADVFNLLRSIFPFTVKWGGGNKPDGFSSLVFFPDNDLSKPTKYNWSYDAKYTDSTYSFGIGEHRQMFDYVRRLHAPKRLKSLGNKYDAHVFITNSMTENAMSHAADFMATQHRLGEKCPDFQLVFMRDSFLTKLWELVRKEESEFDKRGTYLAEFFTHSIRDLMNDGYCLLDESAAIELAKRVLEEEPIQDPVDAGELEEDLKRQMNPGRPSKKALSRTPKS